MTSILAASLRGASGVTRVGLYLRMRMHALTGDLLVWAPVYTID